MHTKTGRIYVLSSLLWVSPPFFRKWDILASQFYVKNPCTNFPTCCFGDRTANGRCDKDAAAGPIPIQWFTSQTSASLFLPPFCESDRKSAGPAHLEKKVEEMDSDASGISPSDTHFAHRSPNTVFAPVPRSRPPGGKACSQCHRQKQRVIILPSFNGS